MKEMLQRNKNFRRTLSEIPQERNQGNSQTGSNNPRLQSCQDAFWEVGALRWFSLPWHAHTHEFNAMSPLSQGFSNFGLYTGPGSQTISNSAVDTLQKRSTRSPVLSSSLFPLHQTSRRTHVPCQVTQPAIPQPSTRSE